MSERIIKNTHLLCYALNLFCGIEKIFFALRIEQDIVNVIVKSIGKQDTKDNNLDARAQVLKLILNCQLGIVLDAL